MIKLKTTYLSTWGNLAKFTFPEGKQFIAVTHKKKKVLKDSTLYFLSNYNAKQSLVKGERFIRSEEKPEYTKRTCNQELRLNKNIFYFFIKDILG